MYSYKLLDQISMATLHEAFVDAFSDYQVKMDLPFWRFQQMLQRRGYHPEISMGAFKDERMVGFVINGLRSWKGKTTAYDLGTGVVEDCRRQGITSDLLLNIQKLLKEKNVEQYLLEVIQSNESAVQLYSKQNFKIQREFSCFQLQKINSYRKRPVRWNVWRESMWSSLRNFGMWSPPGKIQLIPSTLYRRLLSMWLHVRSQHCWLWHYRSKNR